MNAIMKNNSFTVDDIRELRSYNAERRAEMSRDEIRKEINDRVMPLLKRIEEKRKTV